jgi:hypothetical protein
MHEFLDRVAGSFWDRVRALLEQWVQDYCPEDRDEMVRRLQTGTDLDFHGAYWELLLYHGLKALGFTVECHPQIDGTEKRPDFRVTNGDCEFLLEAKVLGESNADNKQSARRQEIYSGLDDRVTSDDFFVRVGFIEEGKTAIPITKLAAAVQDWLDGLDSDEVSAAMGPDHFGGDPLYWDDEKSGWGLALTPIPKSTSQPGDRVVGIMGGEAKGIDDSTPIRRALDFKAHKYGDQLGLPLVVAIGVARIFPDDTDIAEALFGDEVYRFSPDTGDGYMDRKPNGLWLGPKGPKTRRLSAVLTGFNPAPWRTASIELTLWKNPWADHPLDCSGDGVIRVIDPSDDGSLHATPASVPPYELLGLPEDWPGPEPAFA